MVYCCNGIGDNVGLFVHLRPLDAGIALPKGLALFTIALAFVRQTI